VKGINADVKYCRISLSSCPEEDLLELRIPKRDHQKMYALQSTSQHCNPHSAKPATIITALYTDFVANRQLGREGEAEKDDWHRPHEVAQARRTQI
jgi:hypothetical protein